MDPSIGTDVAGIKLGVSSGPINDLEGGLLVGGAGGHRSVDWSIV